jgi:shikimate kinase
MGAGKSTVGAALAFKLKRPFLDLDREVEAAAGLSVAEIFAEQGERAFRKLEQKTLADLMSKTVRPLVIALGGGTWMDEGTRSLLKQSGCVTVFLFASASELWQRCEPKPGERERPLRKDEAGFRNLYAQRLPQYESCDIQLDTSGRTIAQIVDEIQQQIGDKYGIGAL